MYIIYSEVKRFHQIHIFTLARVCGLYKKQQLNTDPCLRPLVGANDPHLERLVLIG